jgi:hypothetical protein
MSHACALRWQELQKLAPDVRVEPPVHNRVRDGRGHSYDVAGRQTYIQPPWGRGGSGSHQQIHQHREETCKNTTPVYYECKEYELLV